MLYETVLDRDALRLLQEYCILPFLKTFSLAGGTALALRLGHRISYDIDLFSYENFNVVNLDTELDSYYGLGYIKRGNLTSALFSTVNSIKSDFIFDYGEKIKEIEYFDNIRLYSLEENIAMKMNAICGRGRKRDFYDLHFILKDFSISEILNFFLKKYGEAKMILCLKSITYFQDAENDEEPVLLKEEISWSGVKKNIIAIAKTKRL